MTDRRLHPDPERITEKTAAQITLPVVDLNRSPDGPRDRQALLGEALTVLDRTDGTAYVQLTKDNYCGYISETAIGPAVPPTHVVTAPATHAYTRADLKSPDVSSLSFGSRVVVTGAEGRFAQTSLGHIPTQHLAPLPHAFPDPAAVAELFLGTPYLWGGNSRWGIDCSGLVQAAFLACGIPCPGDSDQQQTSFADTVAGAGPVPRDIQRNDLLFWKGHVALVLDPATMIHANAHHMAVTREPIQDALTRIAKTDGPLTGHKRLSLSKWP